MSDALAGKTILIVDDEPDVLETLKDLLDMCVIDCASDFNTAKRFLSIKSYDAAIFDIMGVNGYDLIEISEKKATPALMLTAHSLSPDHLIGTLKKGAYSYIPKHEMADISSYLAEVIDANEKVGQKPKKWFKKLAPYFKSKFGSDWETEYKDSLKNLGLAHTREELEKIL
jgi:DNA-binding NtrC family response regulator